MAIFLLFDRIWLIIARGLYRIEGSRRCPQLIDSLFFRVTLAETGLHAGISRFFRATLAETSLHAGISRFSRATLAKTPQRARISRFFRAALAETPLCTGKLLTTSSPLFGIDNDLPLFTPRLQISH
jgi:hypothetical protein